MNDPSTGVSALEAERQRLFEDTLDRVLDLVPDWQLRTATEENPAMVPLLALHRHVFSVHLNPIVLRLQFVLGIRIKYRFAVSSGGTVLLLYN